MIDRRLPSRRTRKSKVQTRDFDSAAGIPDTDKNHTSIRLDAGDRRKLGELAREMNGGITKSAVVRLLIRAAYVKMFAVKEARESKGSKEER